MRAAYKHWHDVLSTEFFGPEHALQSIVLYLDVEIQQDLAERHSTGTSLAQAVADELIWDEQEGKLFTRIQRQCVEWANSGSSGPPPSLPVLALSVLAATRMASSDGMLKTNFYGRWVQLFGEQAGSYRANKLVHAFLDVTEMWEELHTWLEQTGGLYGTSTVSTGDPYWKIGYPISQALVRGSDRQVLTRFFAATRLRPNNPNQVSGRELLRRLRVWTSGHDRGLSHRLLDEMDYAAENAAESNEPLITSLLRRLADDWDGTLHEPERGHRRRAHGLRLVVADRGSRAEWLAEAVDGLPEAQVSMPGGRTFMLRKEYGGVYGGLETLQPSLQQLADGVRLEGDMLVLEWVPQEVVLLRMHPHLGEWVSTEYFEPGEQHWILAADTAAHDVRTMVEALGTRKVREAVGPVAGWRLFKGVRAVSGTGLTRTLDRGGAHVHVLEPQVRQRAELSGGLRIAPEYRGGAGVAGHYLRGGAPDLRLPVGEPPDGLVEVVLDGRAEKLRADPRIPFPLWLVPLEEGKHRVGTAQSSELFTLHDGLHEGVPPGTGSLGYHCVGGTAARRLTEVESAESVIRGACLPVSCVLPRTELVRSAVLEAVLVDPGGRVLKVQQQPTPTWMRQRGLPEDVLSPCLEIEVPEGYVWLVYRTAARWSVRALVEDPRIPPPTPDADDFAWAYAVLSAADRLRTPAWRDYVAAASEIVGKRGVS
ncbi:hypothetical protein GCM10010313_44720 [Streptomyces violarus]|uniref:Uncharacterized protein n=1 Tax=Streptomyces violarus TaxID=67380 RepID=A0A7W5F2C0_9ACTN|nr:MULTISPECIES: hypothetical protein [Streptomyces]MBB3077389.1 hypothetical protein [Streptomyces violarus]WRU00986.1 hypothetical protein VJ737_26370 [Streptomyces sp. CGMCC 4.1772]GHD16439.1 hypothetical protein GCM10010313_44720 [Streptomyces violarus]